MVVALLFGGGAELYLEEIFHTTFRLD